MIGLENCLVEELENAVNNFPKITKKKLGKAGNIEEIRLRINRKIIFIANGNEYFIDKMGNFTLQIEEGEICKKELLEKELMLISNSSFYALEGKMDKGYITVLGGHRIGICGEVVVKNGKIALIKNVSSLNIRLAREVEINKQIINELLGYNLGIYSVENLLIASLPGIGKTTLLRNIGKTLGNTKGMKVAIIDERSEIAAVYEGVPQLDIGERTDILDAAPKSLGIIQLIRSMSPNVIILDEIGSKEDLFAINEGIRAGISIITTAHGKTLEEILERPYLGEMIREGIFKKIAFINRNENGIFIEKLYKF